VPTPSRTSDRLARDDDDLVEVQGARPSEPLLVRRAWLRDHLAKAPPQPRRSAKGPPPRFAPCDPLTGARLDPGDHLTTDAYRPGAELAALVRARDGRCRFPGCSIAAPFCDLDHVRPWPTGRTTARNLLTLCRRHHRIKQRPGWRLHLAPDATTTWTDPTGRERTTAPLNALEALVLRADPADPTDPPGAVAPTAIDAEPLPAWSSLETHIAFAHGHHITGVHPDHAIGHVAIELDSLSPAHRRCTSAARLRDEHRRRRTWPPLPDEPPF
jgi:hypothetical protein